MRKQRKKLPSFASEEDELRFWDEHDPSEYIEGPAEVIVRLKRREARKTRTITMRIDEPLYEQLRAIAAEHDLPYQRLMRELLRQSLTVLLTRPLGTFHVRKPARGTTTNAKGTRATRTQVEAQGVANREVVL
ncbi:MAG: BrnA antitoxin family protein [Armatimonadetes bacterium]|nr:BrnA antitoxin family protein [Armatimonadota bacterium]